MRARIGNQRFGEKVFDHTWERFIRRIADFGHTGPIHARPCGHQRLGHIFFCQALLFGDGGNGQSFVVMPLK